MLIKIAYVSTIDMSLRYLLLNQMLNLRECGYEVIGISAPRSNVSVLEQAGIRHIPVSLTRSPFTPLKDLRALWQLYRIIRREKFTIVHTHSPKAGFLGQLAAKMAGVPIIINTVHGFYFTEGMDLLLRRLYIGLEKIAAICSDLIFSVNREDIETALCENICRYSKIKLLGRGGIGIDFMRFNPEQFSPDVLWRKRIEVGLPQNTRVVGFVGRLVKEKGLLELFAAARLVRRRIPNVRILIVGPVDTDKSDALTPEAAHNYGIADICHFLGMRNDMPELYALMDVFVLSSHREGFPRAPMEASAMGVPCVVTDIRGCREAVEHGRNGLLVPLGDIRALADAIVELLTNRDRAHRMGEEGQHIARERFNERLVFERVKAEYRRLLHEKGIVNKNQ